MNYRVALFGGIAGEKGSTRTHPTRVSASKAGWAFLPKVILTQRGMVSFVELVPFCMSFERTPEGQSHHVFIVVFFVEGRGPLTTNTPN